MNGKKKKKKKKKKKDITNINSNGCTSAFDSHLA